MGSYIKIDRKILEWEWYENINTCRLFLHLLIKANWKDGRFQGTDIPRGSLVSSIARLSEETGLTSDEVRTALKHLKSTGEITSTSHSKYTVFTVKNYSVYQDIPDQIPSRSHSIPILFPTIEEGKKEKKESKEVGKQGSREEKRKTEPGAEASGTGKACHRLEDFLLDEKYQKLADNESLIAAVREWLQYKTERREAYKPSGLRSLLMQIQKKADQYSPDIVIDLMQESMSNGWRGIIWERAEKLTGSREPSSQSKNQKPRTRFHNFEERNYDYDTAIYEEIRKKAAEKRSEKEGDACTEPKESGLSI